MDEWLNYLNELAAWYAAEVQRAVNAANGGATTQSGPTTPPTPPKPPGHA